MQCKECARYFKRDKWCQAGMNAGKETRVKHKTKREAKRRKSIAKDGIKQKKKMSQLRFKKTFMQMEFLLFSRHKLINSDISGASRFFCFVSFTAMQKEKKKTQK